MTNGIPADKSDIGEPTARFRRGTRDTRDNNKYSKLQKTRFVEQSQARWNVPQIPYSWKTALKPGIFNFIKQWRNFANSNPDLSADDIASAFVLSKVPKNKDPNHHRKRARRALVPETNGDSTEDESASDLSSVDSEYTIVLNSSRLRGRRGGKGGSRTIGGGRD